VLSKGKTQYMKPNLKKMGKIILILLVVLSIAVISFAGGIVFHANFSEAPQVASITSAIPFFSPAPDKVQAAGDSGHEPAEIATFWEAWSFLDEQFYGQIPPDNERVYGAIRGMVASFDDQHTAFIDPVRAAISRENIQGSFSGIGATVRQDEAGRLVIADPMPGHPAALAGVRPGDIVLEVDGQSVEGLSLFEAVLLIRGPTDTTVVLTILREGEPEPFDIAIVRAEIELEVVESELLESPDGDKIGYVRLTQFSKGAAAKVTEVAEELFDQGATSLIFDLRSNPGGLLSEAVDVSSLFIENGPIVIERLKNKEDKVFKAKHGLLIAGNDMPLVILVNGGSASASEIVAGAMQDSSRAIVIGEQTFGKGSVQLPHLLSDGSELRVTIAEWLTPAERQIHGQGITPDIPVEMTFEQFEQGLDPQLDEAIRYLSEERGEKGE
jgi:carboxyl-terminal processing protease